MLLRVNKGFGGRFRPLQINETCGCWKGRRLLGAGHRHAEQYREAKDFYKLAHRVSRPPNVTGVQLRAPEGAKRPTSPSAATPCWAAFLLGQGALMSQPSGVFPR